MAQRHCPSTWDVEEEGKEERGGEGRGGEGRRGDERRGEVDASHHVGEEPRLSAKLGHPVWRIQPS